MSLFLSRRFHRFSAPTPPGDDTPWSDSNPPWALKASEALTDGWPAAALTMIKPLSSNGATFRDRLNNTLSAGPCIVQLPAGTYHLNAFYQSTTGTNRTTTHGYGYLQPANLRGLLGAGANQTYIMMDPNSYTSEQVSAVSALSSSNTIQFYMMIFAQGNYSTSGPTGNPLYISGITFKGSDQQPATSGAAAGTPTPYSGVHFRGVNNGIIQYCRFQGCGRNFTTSPPYEIASLGMQYNNITVRRIESDGRLAPDVNSARPRRSGVLMMNNEFNIDMQDSWLHHGLLARYAVNDGNRPTTGTYRHTRLLLEEIGNVNNSGATHQRVPTGYENVGGNVIWTDTTIKQPATNWDRAHMQFTTVGGQSNSNPPAGTLNVTNCTFTHGHTPMDGYFVLYLSQSNNWWTGNINTIPVVIKKGTSTLTPYRITSQPSTASLSNAGVSKDTHFLLILGG